ncbi:hypothetical protein FOA52_005380 [Chlamydomonas sp. UWO 241]|nr:hypothetical protein FOA52_005380 [Chlamydomonas sp. UWO 241]
MAALAAKLAMAGVCIVVLNGAGGIITSGIVATLGRASWTGVVGVAVGGPAVLTALAMVLHPRMGGTASRRRATGAPTGAPFSFATSLGGSPRGGQGGSRQPGVWRGLARRLGKRLKLGHAGVRNELSAIMEVPFMRRPPSGSRASSSKGSSEQSSVQSYRLAGSVNRRPASTMARIASGHNLFEEDGQYSQNDGRTALSITSKDTRMNDRHQPAEQFVYNGHLAVDCLPYDTTEPVMAEVKKVVTEQHLLQFGMMIGESSAELAIGMQGAPGAVGPAGGSLYGPADSAYAGGWERIVEEHKEGVHYWVDRRPLRRGLHMYKSRTVYERCTPQQMVAFNFGTTEVKRDWDDSVVKLHPLPPPCLLDMPESQLETATHGQSAFVYARSRFPPPMAQREYIYARRVWYKVDDGGCYCISRACAHPAPPPSGCRTQRIEDFINGYVIRGVPGIYSSATATEVVTNYFEDSRAHSGIINMAVRKALWPMTQKSEGGLRRYIARAAGALPPRRAPPFPKSLPYAFPVPAACSCTDLDLAVVPARASASGSASSATTTTSGAWFAAVTGAMVPAGTTPTGGSGGSGSGGTPSSYAFLNFTLDTAFTNASMFSGYYPALTTRLQIAPILYAGYLAMWRAGVAVVDAARFAAAATHRALTRWHRWGTSRAGQALGRALNAARVAAGLPPLLFREPAPSSFPIKGPSRARRLVSRAGRFAGVAVKAVGLQLVHGLVAGRLGAAPSSQAPPATPPPSASHPMRQAASALPFAHVFDVGPSGSRGGNGGPCAPPPTPTASSRNLQARRRDALEVASAAAGGGSRRSLQSKKMLHLMVGIDRLDGAADGVSLDGSGAGRLRTQPSTPRGHVLPLTPGAGARRKQQELHRSNSAVM